MNDILEQLPDVLQHLFLDVPQEINDEVRLVQRRRVITPSSFVRTLVFGWLDNPDAGMAQLAEYATSLLGTPLSESGLRGHFTQPAIDLLSNLLDRALGFYLQGAQLPSPLLQRFNGVFVFDTTSVHLPAHLARFFPGPGNQHGSTASCKVLLGLELSAGAMTQVELCCARLPDQALAPGLHPVPEGALTMHDLGFFGLKRFAEQALLGNYFFSRAHPQLVVQLPGGASQPLLEYLRGRGAEVDEEEVELGSKDRLRCRLIAWRVPDAVAQRRKQKRIEQHARKQRRRSNKKRRGGRVSKGADKARAKAKAAKAKAAQGPSAEQLEWCEWVVVLTNVPAEKLSVKEAEALLRARWQIELLIKLWKGYGGLERQKGRKRERVHCELLAKLLGQVVGHWALLASGKAYVELSVTRGAQQVRKYAERLGQALGQGREALCAVLAELAVRIARCGRRQRRRKDPSAAQRLAGELPPWFSEEPPPEPEWLVQMQERAGVHRRAG